MDIIYTMIRAVFKQLKQHNTDEQIHDVALSDRLNCMYVNVK